MKKQAFTFGEVMLGMMILGILAASLVAGLKPGEFKKEALLKAGSNMQYQVDFAIKSMLAKSSTDFTMLNLVAVDKTKFSVTDDDAQDKFIALLKKHLIGIRKTMSASYLSADIVDNDGNKVTDPFPEGFVLKNGTYFAVRLNGNCTTTEDTVYDPAIPNKRTQTKSCGLIFYDVNGETSPNVAGIDQYIIPFGKRGTK